MELQEPDTDSKCHEQAFAVSNIGAGAAVAVVIFIFLLIFSLSSLNFLVGGRAVIYKKNISLTALTIGALWALTMSIVVSVVLSFVSGFPLKQIY